jgi:two-component sensor histidine kinase
MPDNVKSLSDLSPGTGLTLIKAMVQDLKGELQLLQQEHTTFALRFPLPEQTQEQVGRPSAVGAS